VSSRNEPDTRVREDKSIYMRQAETRLQNRGFRLRRYNEPPDEILLARRPLYYISFLLVLFSGILRQPLLFVAALMVFVLAFVPELWYRFCLRQLTVKRTLPSTRFLLGDSIPITLSIENRKPLPLPWCEVVDELSDALPVEHLKVSPASSPDRVLVTNTFSLWAYQVVRRRYRIRALTRGAYRFGPVGLRATDPFGILTREATLSEPAAVVVHPLVVPLERFGLPALAPFGEQKAPRRLLEDPLRIVGVRDYVPGDEPRRIHWKATARMGTLQSKVYEPSTSKSLALFLDVRTLSQTLMGYDPALLELHICAAASVANWAITQGYAVGVFANGTLGIPEFVEKHAPSPEVLADAPPETAEERFRREIERTSATLRMRIPPSPRVEQLTTIFDGLARVLPYYGLPIEQLIAAEERDLPTGASVIYIGTEDLIDVPLIIALRRLKAHGHAVSALLTRSHQTQNTQETPEEHAERRLQLTGIETHYIGGRLTWEELLGETVGPEALAFFRSRQRGLTAFTGGTGGSPASTESSTSDSLAEPPDSLDSHRGEQNGADNERAARPTHKTGGYAQPRSLVVD
jgi:uncharacterized protein (DUF58 family)